LYVVADDNGKNGICDSNGALVYPMANMSVVGWWDSDSNTLLFDSDSGCYSLFDISLRKSVFTYPQGTNVFFEQGEYYLTRNGSKCGVSNIKGASIVPAKYNSVCYLGDGRFIVQTYAGWFRISNGELTDPLPAGISFTSYPGLSYFEYSGQDWITVYQNGKAGAMDKDFHMLVPCVYDEISGSEYDKGYYIVCKDNKRGLVDSKGAVCIPVMYEIVQSIAKGQYYIAGFVDDILVNGIVDTSSKPIVPLTGDMMRPVYVCRDYTNFLHKSADPNSMLDYSSFNMQTCLKKTIGDKVGLFALDGTTIIPAEYDAFYSTASVGGSSPYLNSDAIIAVKGGKTGVITIDNEIVLPFQYDGINVDYGIPNNYTRAQYFLTRVIDGYNYKIGAVNRNNESVADTYTLDARNIPDGIYLAGWFDPEPPNYNGPTGGFQYTFSPINGLVNGISGLSGVTIQSDLKSKPESPVLKYAGYSFRSGDTQLYGASYKGRGTLVAFDNMSKAASPVLDSWERDIAFTIGQVDWVYNGAVLENDVAPFISNENRAMVPVRVIAECFGATVSWNDVEKKEYIIKGDKTMTLSPGIALPDNMGTPILKDDRLFVPVRYVAEAFAGEVSWDQRAKTVSIKIRPVN